MTGPVSIKKAKSFYDEMKTADNCTFSEGWSQNFKQSAAEVHTQMADPTISCRAQVTEQ